MIQTPAPLSGSKDYMTSAAALPAGGEIDWDTALLQRAQCGDVHAFERLYREHCGRVYGLCLRLTRNAASAEDCTQETFINAWRALSRFETRSSMRTWLHRIAVNVVLRTRRRLAATAEIEMDASAAESMARQWQLDTPVEESEIEAAIAALPQGARDVLVLVAIHGYSHEEAAQMLGLAEGTCKAQLHRARQLMRQRLDVEIR
jgi:RNA polymerase sigma-70 factor (ECF subfamily)